VENNRKQKTQSSLVNDKWPKLSRINYHESSQLLYFLWTSTVNWLISSSQATQVEAAL